jgi:hypothetical protein
VLQILQLELQQLVCKTTVRRVFARISSSIGYSGIGITTSNYFGNFSWGKIKLRSRTEENEFNFYGNVGVGGISTSAYAIRTVPLKYIDYKQ